MELMEKILSRENMLSALKAVKRNKGAAGIDKVTVGELDEYFRRNWTEMKAAILEKRYKPQPVRRVYIPKSNGKMRPLGIPTVADRVIQQAVAQELVRIFDTSFSNYSHGFRPQRSCHTAMEQVLQNLNDGYEWVIDLDICKCNMSDEDIFKVANSRLGLYRRCSMNVVNYLLSPKVLEKANKKEGRPALVNPLTYYLG